VWDFLEHLSNLGLIVDTLLGANNNSCNASVTLGMRSCRIAARYCGSTFISSVSCTTENVNSPTLMWIPETSPITVNIS